MNGIEMFMDIVAGGAAIAGCRFAWDMATRDAVERKRSYELARLQIETQGRIAEAQAKAAEYSAITAASMKPRTVTYSPSIAYSPHSVERIERSGSQPIPSQDQHEPKKGLPGITDFANLGFIPTTQQLLLGVDSSGPVTVSAKDLCHVGLVGATGQGKSNTIRLLSSQLLACGVQCLFADPHFTEVDPESGEDWRLIARRLAQKPAVKPDDIDTLLDWLVSELDHRLDLRSRGIKPGFPMVLFADELPIILEIKGAMNRLTRILREGRKVFLYFVGASQDMLVKTLGGGGAIRDCFRTAFYAGGDLSSGSRLLDIPQRDIDESVLVEGVVYLRSKSTIPTRLVRVPYVSNEAIAGLLTDDHATMPNLSSGIHTGDKWETTYHALYPEHTIEVKQLDAKAERVKQMLREKNGQNEIVRQIWNCEPNTRAGREALEELRSIIASMV
jgi:hypothetical protein